MYYKGYQYKNGTITHRLMKTPPKTDQDTQAPTDPTNMMNMEEFIEILSQISMQIQWPVKKSLKNDNKSLKRSVRIIADYSRLLGTSRAAL
jgi:hypothetical protein